MVGLSPTDARGPAREELFAIPSGGEHIIPANMQGLVTGLEGNVLVPRRYMGGPARRLLAVADGNRAAFLPELRLELWGRTFMLGVKGIGARSPMFDGGRPEADEPAFHSESWFGESPWGAMARQTCLEDRELTEMAGPEGINGFHLCPMVRGSSLPVEVMGAARGSFWYRRFDGAGPYFQEFRLLPSAVRLFYQSESTVGGRTSAVLDMFGATTPEALDDFIQNYLRSGLAALTLVPRTLKGGRALDYQDVWLDKDSVIAPDGTLFFADIEGLAWVRLPDPDSVAALARRQYERNFYEFMYGLDRLLAERDRRTGRTPERAARRVELAGRLELSLEGDRFARVERSGGSVDIVTGGTALRFLDLGEGKA